MTTAPDEDSGHVAELSEHDQALLFDVFCRVAGEETGRHVLVPEGFSVRVEARSDGVYLMIRTGLSHNVAIEWDGSFADAVRTIVDVAISAAFDIDTPATNPHS